MGTASDVPITPGSGANVATYVVTESTVVKEIQRIALNDSLGNELFPPIAPTVSASAEGTHLFKNSAGVVKGCYAVNLTSTPGFLILIDAASIPSDGAVTPVAVVPLPADDVAEISAAALCALQFVTGIVAVLTSASTPFTKTTGTITGFISCQFI